MGTPAETFAEAVRRHRAGDLDAAGAAYRGLLEADPGHHGALHLLGVLEHQRGRHTEAAGLISRAIGLDAGRAAYRNNLGVALKALGRPDDAADAYREALRLAPGYADAHSNLGALLHATGRPGEAEHHFAAALAINPGHADALYNFANLLCEQGRVEQAVPLYVSAERAAPGRADVPNNLGNALVRLVRPGEAAEAYRRSLALAPDDPAVLGNLANALAGLDCVEEAGECLERAARSRPDEPHWAIRAAALCPAVFPDRAAVGRYRDALEAALDATPGGVRLPPGGAAASGCHPPFNLSHHGRNDRGLKVKFARAFLGNFRETPPAPRRRTGPPRVGFVATHSHEGMFFRCTAGIIDRLDPGRFEVVVFGSARGVPAMRAAVRRPGVEFVALPDDFDGAAARVAEAGCDVLYHWQVGSDALNYFLPFARPAPVQCTSWGTHLTSGVPAVDFYLSSELIEPPGADAHYSETLVRLATLPTYQRPIRPPDPPASRAEFGLPEGARLYACPQRLAKFHPDFDALLAGVLRADPKGLVVALEDRAPRATGRLRARLRSTVPDVADRVVFLPRQPGGRYLRLLSLADVALDPPHYGAGATAYDVLGLGLPLVTRPGALHVGRYAAGCYRKMGYTDLVADSDEAYVALAVRLGADREFRAAAAARVRSAAGVLFEDDEAVREHERFFERAAALARGAPAPAGR